MDKPSQLIIIGGGPSIREGISKGLWQRIQNKFVIGINFSYKYHKDPTIQCFLDWKFFQQNKEEMLKLPLIVTKKHNKISGNNMIYLRPTTNYRRDLSSGAWKGSLTGIYAVSLGIYLLDEGTIFLLGYDFDGISQKDSKKPLTHYFQGQYKHNGVGKVSYYRTKGKAQNDFHPFAKEKKVKIYNVSLNSKIPQFEKISYDKFFSLLNNKKYNQVVLREWIKNKLKGKPEK